MTGQYNDVLFDTDSTGKITRRKLFLVAEGLQVLNQEVYKAVVEHDGQLLVSLARNHLGTGADALAVSLGSGRTMAQSTPWVADTLLKAVNVPLFFSANILAHPRILRAAGPRIVINAVTADPSHLPGAMQAAGEYGCSLVVLLVRPGLTPTGVQDRLDLAAQVIDLAADVNLSPGQLYLDPVLSCRPDPAALAISRGLPDVGTVAETITLIKELDPTIRTLVGLGTCTQGMAGDRREPSRRSIVSLLAGTGLDAVIMNCRDTSLNSDFRTRTSLPGQVDSPDISRAA